MPAERYFKTFEEQNNILKPCLQCKQLVCQCKYSQFMKILPTYFRGPVVFKALTALSNPVSSNGYETRLRR